MTSDDEEAVFVRLRHAFARNVKSRSEAARVRNALAANVNSYIIYDEHDEGFPTHVRPTGKDVIGIRRSYLDALRANVEARERYRHSSVKARDSKISQEQQVVSKEDLVLSHLDTSRLRRNYQELCIRSHYVHSLSQDASASCNLDISLSEQLHGTNGDNVQDLHERIATSATEVKTLTSKLQRAILQAKQQVEKQKALIAETRQARPDSTLAGSGARARAVAATRDVLVAWLDEKLSEGGAGHAQSLTGTHGESNDELSHSLPSVAEQYQRYLDIRKALVQAAAKALRPLLSPPHASNADNKERIIGEQSPASDDLPMIHATSQYLLPLLRIQADTSAFRSYLTAQTAKDRQDTIDVLERLRDESHLLSTYPGGGINGKDELTRSLEIWKYATNAASGSALKVIEQNERVAQQALKNGKDALAQLTAYNDDHDTSSRKGEGIKWKGIHGELRLNDAA